MSYVAEAKRLAPQPVKSVTKSGLRYEALHWADSSSNVKQNGGYVRVVNIRSGLPICTKQIYVTKYDDKMETDVQDNFITNLKIETDSLIVSSERLSPIKKSLAHFCD